MKINIGGVEFKNPVIGASGTFGFGREIDEYYPIEKLGGIATKGLTLESRLGNEGIRIHETASGIMNSIGLQNPGVRSFIEEELPFLKEKDLVIMANLGGSYIEDYVEAVKLLNNTSVDIIELNISCPNVRQGGMAFGIKCSSAGEIVREIRKNTDKPLVVKLSPNAENIVEMAVTCQESGADGLSLVNTFNALAIDINTKKPVFNNITAGLSGPAIKPIALRMVYQVCKSVSIPVIGLGGISTWEDGIEYIMAGASAIEVGTANFTNPMACLDIVRGMEEYMVREGIRSLDEIRGII